jgi:endo-1,4-beta-xylanase
MLASCGHNDPIPPVEPDPVSLRDAAPFPVGAALSITKLKNSDIYRTVAGTEFSSVTPENAMKMVNLAPSRKDQYSWADADYLVDFAKNNNMRIHGHCLVWHQSLPSWINSFSGTKDDWKALLHDYITTVVDHFKGKVASWDVVNEALMDDGTLRQTIWLTKIGWEYVELAFRYAHEADPNAVLFYNDYGQEYSKVKLAAINDTVMSLISRGVPIHGIGLQMHTNITQSAENIAFAISQTAATGLKVHISELDIALNNSKNLNYIMNDTDLATQKSRYRTIAAAMCSVPASQRWGFTTWGLGDNDSWLTGSPDFPLLFDGGYKPKSCYYGVQEAFSSFKN